MEFLDHPGYPILVDLYRNKDPYLNPGEIKVLDSRRFYLVEHIRVIMQKNVNFELLNQFL